MKTISDNISRSVKEQLLHDIESKTENTFDQNQHPYLTETVHNNPFETVKIFKLYDDALLQKVFSTLG